MDPDAALLEALELARAAESVDLIAEDADRLAELVLGLHEWLSGGGYLPQAWVLAKTRIVQDANYLPSGRPGAAMGRAIAEAEDRRSLAQARKEGWPIVERDGASGAKHGGE